MQYEGLLISFINIFEIANHKFKIYILYIFKDNKVALIIRKHDTIECLFNLIYKY